MVLPKKLRMPAKITVYQDSVLPLYSRRGELFNNGVKLDREQGVLWIPVLQRRQRKIENSCGGFRESFGDKWKN